MFPLQGNMATLKKVIRKNKINQLGQTIVYIQYNHQGKTTYFSTHVKIHESHWNEKKQVVNSARHIKRNKQNEGLINDAIKSDDNRNIIISRQLNKISNIVESLTIEKLDHTAEKEEPTVEKVKQLHSESLSDQKKEDSKSDLYLIDLIKEYIRTSLKSEATIKNYNTALFHLEGYQKKRNKKLTLKDLNNGFENDFKSYLYKEHEKPDGSVGLVDNSVGTTLKNLKVFLTHFKKMGHNISLEISEIKVPKHLTQVYFLTYEEIMALYHCDLKFEEQIKARDLFVFNCFLGARMSDLKRLRKEHIAKDGVIRMIAYKNKGKIVCPLTPISKIILEKYDYKLPQLHDQVYNETIKIVCKRAGITQKVEQISSSAGKKTHSMIPKYKLITSHIAVKTFISLCGKRKISPKVVSEITGKSVKVILDHYYGIDEDTIIEQMLAAFKDTAPSPIPQGLVVQEEN